MSTGASAERTVGPPVILVVPCYNEEQRLAPEAFLGALKAQPRLSLCFVNDGSTDDTLGVLNALVAKAPERMRVLSLAQNSGKAEAVRQGMLANLEGDAPAYVGYWDADLATPFEELPRFVAALDGSPEIDVVLGSRVRLLGREIERRFYRHLYGRVFATAVSLMLGLAVYDTQCGAKLFRRTESARQAFGEGFLSRWIFDVEVLARLVAGWSKANVVASTKILEVPLRIWREIPGSKVGPQDALRAAVELQAIRKRYRALSR